MIEIVATGPFASIQDLGRIGWSHIGVGPSGAWDRGALRLANRLVGNPENAAVIEAVGAAYTYALKPPVLWRSPEPRVHSWSTTWANCAKFLAILNCI